jgi:AraC family L-rhamnose operon transcriptional activator RhaR
MPEQTRLLRGQVFSSNHAPVTANDHLLDGDYVPHDHDFMEVAVVFGGRGTHRTIHGDQPISSGDAFVLRPGVWHAYHRCRSLRVYNCCFGAELLRRELAWISEEPALGRLLQSDPASQGLHGVERLKLADESLEICRRYLDALGRDGDREPSSARVEGIGRLLLFLGELVRSMNTHDCAVVRPEPRVHPFVVEGVRMLEADPSRLWSLAELAERLSVDRSYLARLFKAGTGLPPMAYLNRHRAELAATLLLRTDRPVSRIGEEVGWPDPNYFARRFKAHFGSSATAYRAKMTPPGQLAPRFVQAQISVSFRMVSTEELRRDRGRSGRNPRQAEVV